MTIVRAARLTLRPLIAADIADPRILAWHTDPEGYELMSEQPRRDADAREALITWQASWEREGIGYWIAERDGIPVGIGGVRPLEHEGRRYLNLYYRLDPTVRGAGLATEIASAATAYALEFHSDLPVIARVAPSNEPSLRTVERAGMVGLGPFQAPRDPVDQPANLLFESPMIRTGVGDCYDALVDLWCRVNAAGGAVGWEGESPRAEVVAALDGHLAAEGSTLVRLHAPTVQTWDDPTAYGELLAFGIVQRGTWFSTRHRATLYRVMTDPAHRGHNLGRLLMAGLHRVAREQGVEICEIGYRGGTGLERFYWQLGYVETGRVVGGLRFSWGDEDDVAMAHRL
ncbi:GNAT family N-acetyltransferase [Calidifontibacter terrae]